MLYFKHVYILCYMYVHVCMLFFTAIHWHFCPGIWKKKEICSFETHISLILYFQYEDIL